MDPREMISENECWEPEAPCPFLRHYLANMTARRSGVCCLAECPGCEGCPAMEEGDA